MRDRESAAQLRFGLGMRVMCKVRGSGTRHGGFSPGTIVATDYHEAKADASDAGVDKCCPYQVQLDALDDGHFLIGVPFDKDDVCKSQSPELLSAMFPEDETKEAYTTPLLMMMMYYLGGTGPGRLLHEQPGPAGEDPVVPISMVYRVLDKVVQSTAAQTTAAHQTMAFAIIVLQLCLWDEADVLDGLLTGRGWPAANADLVGKRGIHAIGNHDRREVVQDATRRRVLPRPRALCLPATW